VITYGLAFKADSSLSKAKKPQTLHDIFPTLRNGSGTKSLKKTADNYIKQKLVIYKI